MYILGEYILFSVWCVHSLSSVKTMLDPPKIDIELGLPSKMCQPCLAPAKNLGLKKLNKTSYLETSLASHYI